MGTERPSDCSAHSEALPRWEHFPHGADIGVRGIGPTPDAAFEQAALALTAIVAPPDAVGAHQAVRIQCEAPDLELLLVDWLNAVIYEMATRRLLFGRYAVRLDGNRLTGEAWGAAMSPEDQELAVEPKGATYTALRVRRDGSDFVAECVVDV